MMGWFDAIGVGSVLLSHSLACSIYVYMVIGSPGTSSCGNGTS